MTSTVNSKDTIYVDIDDEITTIIDKVRSSSGRVVALVLPKRATVFQSIVNMKLLKRSADAAKKHLVLVTTEPGLMPLAGMVGLHVAATPQSKPEVPSSTPAETSEAEDIESHEEGEAAYTTMNAGHRPIGELATAAKSTDEIETLQVPDDEEPIKENVKPAKAQKPAKDHRLKVPNFNKFRTLLFIGAIVLVILVLGVYECVAVLPKARIVINTHTSGQNVSLTAVLTPGAAALDSNGGVVPAKIEQQQKTLSQQVATTGQQNNGTAATGTITMAAQECAPNLGQPTSVPAGTGVSTGGLTFITQETTQFNTFGSGHGSCITYQAVAKTDITAQTAGAKFNVSNATFSIAGRSDVTATGSTSNGTDNIIHTVTQADIDSAKQKLGTQDTATVKDALEQTLQGEGLYAVTATFNASDPVVTTSNNVGDQADNVTVTEVITYTMYGAEQSDLDALIKANVAKQIDMQNQVIVKDGLAKAAITVAGVANGKAQVALQTTATVGPEIHGDDIKKQAAGKRAGDVKSMVNAISGVTSVDVQLSPFWVSSVPSNTSKVTVIVNGAQ